MHIDTMAFLAPVLFISGSRVAICRDPKLECLFTCAAEGMAKGNCATLGVQLLLWDVEFLNAVSGLACEGLVDFENVNVFDLQVIPLEQDWNDDSGSNTHDVGWASSNLVISELG